MNHAELLSAMTVSDFRAFKKALAVLMRAGVARVDAITILVERVSARRNEIRDYEVMRRSAR
jgi:hypothetical protein